MKLSNCIDHGQKGNARGYGMAVLNKQHMGAHVKALIVSGFPRPMGAQCLHSCDNPRCINPEHLRWGTQTENLTDRKERHRYRKLTQGDVQEIKRCLSEGISGRTLAHRFNVSDGMIGHIKHERQWKEVECTILQRK